MVSARRSLRPVSRDGHTRDEVHRATQRLARALLDDVGRITRRSVARVRVSAAAYRVGKMRELERLAAEQSALARLATSVASEDSPDDVFASLTEELGLLFEVDASAILRYEADATATVVAGWSNSSVGPRVGERLPIATLRERGFRAAVASPINVGGTTWGVIAVLAHRPEALPADTEARLAQFTRHAGMALANAQSRSDLAQSRARVVRAGDEARRRLERDLHDGAQQRLVSLGLALRAMEGTVAPEQDDLRDSLRQVTNGVHAVLDDLRELARGLHPPELSDGGLTAALRALARRSAVPVKLRIDLGAERFEEPVEVTAYFVAAEALTNTAKHAHGTCVEMVAARDEGWLELVVRDDGCGGAEASNGTGLTGLVDRVEAIRGTIQVDSCRDLGTVIQVRLPITSSRS